MNAATKQRKALNKNKIKEPKIPKEKDKTLILCPLKEVNIYQYICIEKCDYYSKQKCPIQKI